MNRLRNRLILVFAAATLLPLLVTAWISVALLEPSLSLAAVQELDQVSRSLEQAGRGLYQQTRDSLKQDAALGRIPPQRFLPAQQAAWPPAVQEFFAGAEPEHFLLAGEHGDRMDYLVRHGPEVWVYSASLHGVAMNRLSEEYARARALVAARSTRDLRRGFLLLAGAIWVVAFAAMIYLAHRISRPIRQLTSGLSEVAAGHLEYRVPAARDDEIGAAIKAFNRMAEELRQSQERLVWVTRLESWQVLARKMAHEVKNSLTPIRLTMEEIAARQTGPGSEFYDQAAQIVVDEIEALERRVRAFSEFASEPPVSRKPIDVNLLLEERIAFLKAAHPEVVYNTRLAPDHPRAFADEDLVKGVLTNLLENAAQAVKPGGVVLGVTVAERDQIAIEVHDSGPGIQPRSRNALFEPTISFKRGGMGLGLSIARKSALLSGGDIELVQGELGGAAFRVLLPVA